MSDWEIDYDSIVIEEVLDTDSKVYMYRAVNAIKEERYYDAIKEAQTALKYSDGSILAYHFLIVKSSYCMGMYTMCYNYIKSVGIMRYIYEDKDSFSELAGCAMGVDDLMDIYMHCWRLSKETISNAEVIVVIANGKGMVGSLQEAVNICQSNQYIYIMEDTSISGVHIPFDCEGAVVKQGNIKIKVGSRVATNIIVNDGSSIVFRGNYSPLGHRPMLEINGGNVSLLDTSIKGYGNEYVGIWVKNNAKLTMIRSSVSDCFVGIYATGGNILMDKLGVGGVNGIVAVGKDTKVIFDMKGGFNCRKVALAVGWNSEVKYRGNGKEDMNYGAVCLDGGGYQDSSRGSVDIYDTYFSDRVASVNKGVINIYNTKLRDIELSNATVICKECEPAWSKITLRKEEEDKDSVFVCNANLSYRTNLWHRETVRGLILECEWLVQWGRYALAEGLRSYLQPEWNNTKRNMDASRQCQFDIYVEQLKSAVITGDSESVNKLESKLHQMIVWY